MAGGAEARHLSYEQSIEYRAELIELKQRAESSADRTMLTLSGGALALSLTFIGISPVGYHSVDLLVAVPLDTISAKWPNPPDMDYLLHRPSNFAPQFTAKLRTIRGAG